MAHDLPATLYVRGYRVELERVSDDADPARGSWVDVWVTSKGGGHTNSLACLEGEGAFDDGPKVLPDDLDAIRAAVEPYGA